MKIDRINNSNNQYFGTKVIMSPRVIGNFDSNSLRSLRKQIKTLENNGVDDFLLLSHTKDHNICAEAYLVKDGRIINGYPVEEPFWHYADYSSPKKVRRGKNVNLVELYQKAVSTIYPYHITDRRHGTRIKNWLGYVPGIKE